MIRYLTVGEISTIIAFIVFLARFVLPNAFALIFVRALKQQPNAVTWSFIQRTLGASDWPTLLQADPISTGAIEWRVRYLDWFRLAVVSLLAVAAVITPAGLYDRIESDPEPSIAPFEYVSDPSGFGIGSQRYNIWAWRTCIGGYDSAVLNRTIAIDVPCPGDNQTYTITDGKPVKQKWSNGTHYVDVADSRVEIFQSGLADLPPTVASFFDIRSRRIQQVSRDYTTNFTSPVPVDSFVHLGSTVAEDKAFAIDGLIIDARNGQVGFRNNTVPTDAPLGISWQEDLLFVEPDTVCVDVGLSYEYQIPYVVTSDSSQNTKSGPFDLVDEGGFANLNYKNIPTWPKTEQGQLHLEELARVQAWNMLYNTMKYPEMNLSNLLTGEPDPSKSYIGRRMPGIDSQTLMTVSTSNGVEVTDDGSFLLGTMLGNIGVTNGTDDSYRALSNLTDTCDPWRYTSTIDINLFHVKCGFVIGAAVQSNGVPALIPEEGMKMKRKIYSCVSAVKMSIKTVSFEVNGTGSANLSELKIKSITDKQYSDTLNLPLWGIETPEQTLAGEVPQIWGFVSSLYQGTKNLSTIRSPHFYPGFNMVKVFGGLNPWRGSQYLPASDGLGLVLQSTYQLSAESTGFDTLVSTSRNGNADIALLGRWQNLSQGPDLVSRMLRLMFADLAASYFTSSRSWLSTDITPHPYKNDTNPYLVRKDVQVQNYHRQIYYKWPYSIPAFMALAMLLIVVPLAVLFASTGSVRSISRLLRMLAAGRLLTSTDSQGNYSQSYKKWADTYGRRELSIQGWSWAFSSPVLDNDSEKRAPSSSSSSSKKQYAAVSQDERYEQTDVTPQLQSRYNAERSFLRSSGRE